MRPDVSFYFGHHKCATSWVHSIVRAVCRDMGWRCVHFHNPAMFNNDLNLTISQHQFDFINYLNASYQYIAAIQSPFKGFHIIRDPRDIIVSSYFSSLNSHPTNQWPELIPHRQKLQQVSKDEGLFLEIEFIHNVLEDISSWNYTQPHILELRFENVTRDPYQSFLNILQFLGYLDDEKWTGQKRLSFLLASFLRRKIGFPGKGTRIPAEILLGKVFENRFSKRATGRAQGVENVNSHFRKGIAGDWVNHLTNKHINLIKNKYGDSLVMLGYEQDNNW